MNFSNSLILLLNLYILMMNFNTKMYLLPLIIIMPFMSYSLNSLYLIWMSMELNLLIFTPMLIYENNYFKESSFKYFMIQTLSSSLLILSFNFLILSKSNYNLMNNIMNITIMIKLGMIPFHSWFINIMKNLNWLMCFLISSWQKIIPILMMMYSFNKYLMMLTLMISMIWSPLYMMNLTSLRLIMAFSSLINLTWMMMSIISNTKLFFMFLNYYLITNFSIMLMFSKLNIFYTKNLFLMNFKNKMLLMMNLFSISGMPPFLGFSTKILMIDSIIMNKMYSLSFMAILVSILPTFCYMKIMFLMMMTNYSLKKNYSKLKFNMYNKFNFINLTTLTMMIYIILPFQWIT